MKVRFKPNLIVVTAESEEERAIASAEAAVRNAHVFVLVQQDARTFRLMDLGLRADACREPINVTSRSPDAAVRLISNLAHTPFTLDGQDYASVEAFWQGLKHPDEARRLEIAGLHGQGARRAGSTAGEMDQLRYRGQSIRAGTADHWELMARACWAKFSQHVPAAEALLGTGDRPLVHRTRRDSRNIPGIIMADIWMKARYRLRNS